ncbi:MAG: iron(III) transport system substrate-binding protein [Spirochaetes bacterium]|nr:MAG: iron(III) transport system substrate-binding protein [Spirochaetota bacterium]
MDEVNAKKILDSFTAETGTAVQFVQLSSGPAYARIRAESNNPQADVWFGAPSENHIIAKNEKLTQAYKGSGFDTLGKEFKDPDGFWRSFYMNPMAFAVNKEVLARMGAPKPTSWADLLNPVYKGQIQMPSPQSSGTAYNVVASLVVLMGEEKAYDYMKKLAPNIQTYTSSGTAPSKAVQVGQCAIALQFTPAFFEAIVKGFPVEVIFPKEGVWFEAPAVSILKGARNLAAAQELVDWLSSVKGQNVMTDKQTFFYPVVAGAKLGAGMPAFESLKTIDIDPLWAGEQKKRLVERWVQEVLTAK